MISNASTSRAGSGQAISLKGVQKQYSTAAAPAVERLDLEIRPGEFFSLLGPSGCGKTTTLRLIAGFEFPDTGTIRVGERDVTALPAHRREMSLVFQNYALFPHRTVAQNIAFGLRMRATPKAEIERRVNDVLRAVALDGMGSRSPSQLSGGQQQRVALARAIVVNPGVLLCDEPLGALDKQLREEMQVELKRLQRDLGVTLVFVTHDQDEALAMSDRIAVMNRGRIEQIGTPKEIYDQPSTRFTASFIGDTNLFEGQVSRANGSTTLRTADGLTVKLADTLAMADGAGCAALRPDHVELTRGTQALPRNSVAGRIRDVSFHGDSFLYRIAKDDGRPLLARLSNRRANVEIFSIDEPVVASWSEADCVLLDA